MRLVSTLALVMAHLNAQRFGQVHDKYYRVYHDPIDLIMQW